MLSQSDVEALALHTYRHWRFKDDPESYWVTGRRAADILGVVVSRCRRNVRTSLGQTRATTGSIGANGRSRQTA